MTEKLNDNKIITNEVYAKVKYIRLSAHKVRKVLKQIKGKKYNEAFLALEFMPYKSCQVIKKVLKSVAANAFQKYGYETKQLIIQEAFANAGPKMKRFQPRAQGRAFKIHKPTCHIILKIKSYL